MGYKVQKVYVGDGLIWPNIVSKYEADLSTFTLMKNTRGGTAIYQDGYITSTYEGGFAYKNISDAINISNAKIIEVEFEIYCVPKSWSDGCKAYLQTVMPDGSMTTQNMPTLGLRVQTQSASGYTTNNVLIFNTTSYAQATTGGWVPANARSTVKGTFDLESGTASYAVNGAAKWSGSMPSADVTTIKNTTFTYLNLSVETNNKIQNVKVTVTK